MKTVIVTGASGDIGKAICRKFLDMSWNVVACWFSNEDALMEFDEYRQHSRMLFVGGDISKRCDAKRIFDLTIQKFGNVDCVVNNAGISVTGLIQDITDEMLDRIIDTNIKGTFNMCAIAAENMVRNHCGAIVNISSMWGDTGAACEVAYSMTKSAVNGLTKALAKELGPSGIRVNCVSPGLIDTKMNSCYSEEDLCAIGEETPLMRIGTCKEVADAVYFLADESSSFITGQILGVNGGYVI